MDKKTMKWLGALALMMMCAFSFSACGGDDDASSDGGGISSISIVGTWRAYYDSNDPSRGRVYDQITFNSNKTGNLIEEVGYGSDNVFGFTWAQNGNIIRLTLNDNQGIINVAILEVIDNNTIVINNGVRTYTAYRQ